jgi:hypothetical protein
MELGRRLSRPRPRQQRSSACTSAGSGRCSSGAPSVRGDGWLGDQLLMGQPCREASVRKLKRPQCPNRRWGRPFSVLPLRLAGRVRSRGGRPPTSYGPVATIGGGSARLVIVVNVPLDDLSLIDDRGVPGGGVCAKHWMGTSAGVRPVRSTLRRPGRRVSSRWDPRACRTLGDHHDGRVAASILDDRHLVRIVDRHLGQPRPTVARGQNPHAAGARGSGK